MKVYLYTFGCAFWRNQTPPSPLKRPWDLQVSVMHLVDPNARGTQKETQEKFFTENSWWVGEILAMIEAVVNQHLDGRFRELAIAINCVGGKGRSVALAEIAAQELKAEGFEVEVTHLDINKPMPEKIDCAPELSKP